MIDVDVRPGKYGNVGVYGGRGLAEDLLDEVRRRGERAVDAGRDVAVREMERLLRLRTAGPAPRGEPPAKETGDLVRSFRTPPPERYGRDHFRAKIHVDHPGANRLEFGARDARGVETHPHPFAAPAFANKREQIARAMERAL